jgi:hypothetical protein
VYASVPHGREEGVDLGVGRDRLLRPGPPELDGAEAGIPGGGGSLQQGHLGEQE